MAHKGTKNVFGNKLVWLLGWTEALMHITSYTMRAAHSDALCDEWLPGDFARLLFSY